MQSVTTVWTLIMWALRRRFVATSFFLVAVVAYKHWMNILATDSVGFWCGHCNLLHFVWVVDDAKCIAVKRLCVCVCVSVCLSAAACPHYCTDSDVTWGSGRECPLVVHYWANLQSVHALRCYGNVRRTRNVHSCTRCMPSLLVSEQNDANTIEWIF